MTQNKHTPAPWYSFCVNIGQNTDYRIAAPSTISGYYKHINITAGEREANARLIAAAPELLEVLQLVANCHTKANELTELGSYEMSKVKEAIAKAKGE